jgi:hypothetical protein
MTSHRRVSSSIPGDPACVFIFRNWPDNIIDGWRCYIRHVLMAKFGEIFRPTREIFTPKFSRKLFKFVIFFSLLAVATYDSSDRSVQDSNTEISC